MDLTDLAIYDRVPQSSAFGLLLFLIYIKDLQNAIKYYSPFQFADDTYLLNALKSTKVTEN